MKLEFVAWKLKGFGSEGIAQMHFRVCGMGIEMEAQIDKKMVGIRDLALTL